MAAEQSCRQTLGSSGKLTFLILLQALPQRAWLLLGEFQAGSGSRTELLGKFLHAGPSSLYKSCYKPCHTESGCFLKSSRHALAAEQSCWESFGSCGKLAFQVLLQPCHREFGCFLKSSRQALATEQICLDVVASSLASPGYFMAGCSLPASCPKLLAKSFLPKALCQKLLAATVSGRKRAQGELIPYMFPGPGLRSKGCDANRCATGPCWLRTELLGKLLHAGPSSLYKSCYKHCHTESGCFLKSFRHALAAEQSCWESFGSCGKLAFQVLRWRGGWEKRLLLTTKQRIPIKQFWGADGKKYYSLPCRQVKQFGGGEKKHLLQTMQNEWGKGIILEKNINCKPSQ